MTDIQLKHAVARISSKTIMTISLIMLFSSGCIGFNAIKKTATGNEYHVSVTGNDADPGSRQKPLRTIQAAADIAQPGDTITVHSGVYRERINPPRGGESDTKRITYQAAPGEKVVIKGSEVVKDWTKVRDGVWKVTLPNAFFGDFNPYKDRIGGEWYNTPVDGFDRHTGAVYLNGNWLDEAPTLARVLPSLEAQKEGRDVVLGGKTAAYAGTAIAGTDEDTLYQTCRYDLKGYRLAVPNGTYRVTLKFCEPYFDEKGKRVFDVVLQGRTVLESFDILAKVAKFAAHDEVFEGIEVIDGQLKIDIINRVSMAAISGIVVEGTDYSKKINCGGPDWEGYQRDPGSEDAGHVPAHGRPLWFAQVDTENTTIWAQFGDVDPNGELVEINVRQSVFYPDQPGRNYITVRGFTMRQAATPWSGAMSEQIGLIGTHWSKGWIIEDNVISHSMNTGITLGRYDLGRYGIAMPPATAPGFVTSCKLALEHGWSKENIGSHVVRNNRISHCEKNGIHGSLGGVFSTIEGNAIHDIGMLGWINGADLAGLKLLGSVDTIIRNNHIYRSRRYGIWLDWMSQGAHVTGNLVHDNGEQDLFLEVNHGPHVVDNNIFLSRDVLKDESQGGAYAHNLFQGSFLVRPQGRRTPYHEAHSTKIAGLLDIPCGDNRFYNNLLGNLGELKKYDELKDMTIEDNARITDVALVEKEDGFYLEFTLPGEALGDLVTTERLGRTRVTKDVFENPDGSPIRIDRDYFGEKRNPDQPAVGPFAAPSEGQNSIKVWPRR